MMRIRFHLKQLHQTVFKQQKMAGLDKHTTSSLLCRSCWNSVQHPVNTSASPANGSEKRIVIISFIFCVNMNTSSIHRQVQVESRRVQIESRQNLGRVQVECRQSLSRLYVGSRESLQVEYWQSLGTVKVESRQSLGRVQVKSRQNLARVYRQTLGRV